MGADGVESTRWASRYKQNVELLKSGDLDNVALVVERLLRRRRESGISVGESRMLVRAVQILGSEMRWQQTARTPARQAVFGSHVHQSHDRAMGVSSLMTRSALSGGAG